jgi:hypothetical protein
MNQYVRKFVLLLIGLLTSVGIVPQAQDENQATQLAYYLASGDNSVQQVFQVLFSEISTVVVYV